MARCRIPVPGMVCILILAALAVVVTGATPPAPVDPTGMDNLDKNGAYNNALLCFLNTTAACPTGNLFLNQTGKLNVNSTMKDYYCANCANQTLVQLKCVPIVYNKFRFDNNAKPTDVANAVNQACHGTGNFTVIPTPNSATMGAPQWTGLFLGLSVVVLSLFWNL